MAKKNTAMHSKQIQEREAKVNELETNSKKLRIDTACRKKERDYQQSMIDGILAQIKSQKENP